MTPNASVRFPCLSSRQDAHDQKGVFTLAEKALKEYETLYIVRPNLDEEAVDRTVAGVEEYIKTQLGGVVESTDKKGRRRLAYEVNKMRDGYYVLTNFRAKPESIAPLKRMMTLSEDIIRGIVTVREEEAVRQ